MPACGLPRAVARIFDGYPRVNCVRRLSLVTALFTLAAMHPFRSLRASRVLVRGAAILAALTGVALRGAEASSAAQATPVGSLKVAKDFKVELLYTVPKDQQGSWVAMCTDPKGRLIVSDQYGPLYRLTPPPLGASDGLKVEKVEIPIGQAQGLLYAFDSLYVMVANDAFQGRGLYRVRDTNGDD